MYLQWFMRILEFPGNSSLQVIKCTKKKFSLMNLKIRTFKIDLLNNNNNNQNNWKIIRRGAAEQ